MYFALNHQQQQLNLIFQNQLFIQSLISNKMHNFLKNNYKNYFKNGLNLQKKWQKNMYSWIICPGLGRDKYISQFFPRLVKNLPQKSVVVFDANGIFYLCQNPSLFHQLKTYKAIITPYKTELIAVQKAINIDIQSSIQNMLCKDQQIYQVDYQWKLPFTLFQKGIQDIILGPKSFVIPIQQSQKRIANIGDILAGSLAAYAQCDFVYGPALASIIVRMATKTAFQVEGRSLTAMNIIGEISGTIKILQTQPPYLRQKLE